MIELTMNEDYSLSCSTNIIPSQYSGNIPFHLELPDKYQSALVVPGYVYWDGNRKVESAVDNYENGNFSIPANAFSKEGILGIAFSLSLGETTETTTIIEFEVRRSVNTSFSLPDKVLWQNMLKNFMDQYMDKVYSIIIQNLIDKDTQIQTETEALQRSINESIKNVNDLIDTVDRKLDNGDFTLDFKWEGTNLFIKKHTASDWGTGIDLAGPTTVYLDGTIQESVQLSTERDTTAQKVHVQVKTADGKLAMIETSTDDVYLGDNDLTSIFALFKEFFNINKFYNADPTTVLTALNQVLPSSQAESEE